MSQKELTQQQEEWLEEFEELISFEPLYLDRLHSGEISFYEFCKMNFDFARDWLTDQIRSLESHTAYRESEDREFRA